MQSWREILSGKEKCVFFTYVHLTESQECVSYYENDGSYTEHLVAILLTETGEPVSGVSIKELEATPGECIAFDAREMFDTSAPAEFRGGLLVVVRNVDISKPLQLGYRDLVTRWTSPHASSQIGNSGFMKLNISDPGAKKSFFMFCPAVLLSEKIKTIITIFNYSTESQYAENAEFIPVLHNTLGESVSGKAITIAPFGCAVIDVDEWFGLNGRDLLAKTNGRGSVTVHHEGHTLGSYFFHLNRVNGEILSGQHTQPPVPCVFFFNTAFNYWLAEFAKRLPFAGHIIPIISYLKHNPEAIRIFYPHHSVYVGSLSKYLKQARFTIYFKFIGRAFYFLCKRKFVIDEMHLTENDAHNQEVINHNLWNNLKLFQFSRARVESLLYPLLGMPNLKINGPFLDIGPKNEGEVLLYEAHGFTNVTGIDLFTYSPKIKLMDMQAMTFPDNSFDTILCGWVISYCYDVKKAVSEIVRVAKDGALFTCSFVT